MITARGEVAGANSPAVQLDRRRQGSCTSRAAPRPWGRVARRIRGAMGRGCAVTGLAPASRNVVGKFGGSGGKIWNPGPSARSQRTPRWGVSKTDRATTRQDGKSCWVVTWIRTEGTCGCAQIAARRGGSKPLIVCNNIQRVPLARQADTGNSDRAKSPTVGQTETPLQVLRNPVESRFPAHRLCKSPSCHAPVAP